MGKPYSDDLRERVVAAIEAGHSRVKVAELSNMALSTVDGLIMPERTRPFSFCLPFCCWRWLDGSAPYPVKNVEVFLQVEDPGEQKEAKHLSFAASPLIK